MAIQKCGPRVPAHDNRGMSIEWPGSHACTHGEQGPQSVWADFTKLIWDLKYALYKAVYVHIQLVWQHIFFLLLGYKTDQFLLFDHKFEVYIIFSLMSICNCPFPRKVNVVFRYL